ncbi:MAG: hypothetical protein QNJ16_21110 [Rhodobacter sp.]|nr:hypothetical protein [Rhodobacter sp.]
MAKKPGQGPGKKADKAREARLKSALKANIARRKAQTRARAADDNKEG